LRLAAARPNADEAAPAEHTPGDAARAACAAGAIGGDVWRHASLRPLLAEIAARRLAARGQALERLSESAGEEMLGERLWDLVRPDRPFPENRQAPGVSAKDLARMIEALERL